MEDFTALKNLVSVKIISNVITGEYNILINDLRIYCMKNEKYIDIAILLIFAVILSVMAVEHSYLDNVGGLVYTYEPEEIFAGIDIKQIDSIQYQEIKESYGIPDGRTVKNNIITYKSPHLLKIESESSPKIIEIYNKNKYFYYYEGENRIHGKECFPIDDPYVTDIEKKVKQLLDKGDYEFFGYEESNNLTLKVIGKKYKEDGSSYMQKLWIGEVNNVSLPFREEYFIDNTVVSKSTYFYMKVNEQIEDSVFSLSCLPELEVVNDGVIPKYVDDYVSAQNLLNFELKLPMKLPEGYMPSEIAAIPPVSDARFYCIYYNSKGRRIYLNESC
jgi:outer membrane lipoprotein-sorting protein